MKKSTVSIVRCETYTINEVEAAVRKGIGLLGGIDGFVRPGEKIVLKPNILIGTNPQKGVTTHPAVFTAVGRVLQEAGVDVWYGDSSGIGKAEFNLKRSGIKEAADEFGFTLADFDSGRIVHHRESLLVKQFEIAAGVLDANGLISLPRFKTHGFMRFTGAVKNQFGCVPGLLKSQFHVRLPDPAEFAAMLVDINTLIKPRLYIMDGITAMEGNGPRSGHIRHMGVILVSADPVALDATACRMIDLEPEYVPTSLPGEKAGLGTYHAENIEILGEPIEAFYTPDFDVVRSPVKSGTGSGLLQMLKNRVTPRPVIDTAKCTSCGTCIEKCPVEPKAVYRKGPDTKFIPVHDYQRCIRCYCCQEMCPEGAISIKNTLLSKLFTWL